MCLKPGSSIESMHRDAEPGLDPGTDKERRVQSPDELRREIEALRDRISKLSAASLRISSSLDLNTVLREVVESARELTGARYGAITILDDSRSLRGRNDRSEKVGNRGRIFSIWRCIVVLFAEKSRKSGPILPLSQ